MIDLGIRWPEAPTVLCIGAHPDDVEIGCGGTLSTLAEAHPDARFVVWVFSGNDQRIEESRSCLQALLGSNELVLEAHSIADGHFPAAWAEIKTRMHEQARKIGPDVVFCHRADDLHQDHRTLGELALTVFRDQLILRYEIVKYDGDLGRPNVYVPLSRAKLDQKVDALMRNFASQHDKPWFTGETFRALARIRGVECRAPSGYAEAFHGPKLVLGV
jgi:LmbE family N-acetylglucosaminyl deacetylase